MVNKKEKISKADLKKYYEESKGLERNLLSEYAKSKKIAWNVATVGLVFGLIGFSAGFAGFYQEAPTPLVLRVDNATGAVDMVSTVKNMEDSYGEIVDEYWLNQFILNRESYEYNTIQHNYDTTALLSAPDVQKEYYELFTGSKARDVVYGNKVQIKVNVRSIQPNGKGQAIVRFQTKQINKNGVLPSTQDWIATVGYRYIQVPMNRSDRRINPLGFQVTSYRVDPELINR